MQKVRNIYKSMPAALLLAMLVVPFICNLVSSNTELLDNRALHTRPTRLTRHFAKDFESYYNDTFAGREKLISKYIQLKQALQIDTGEYFYGLNGWMFYDSIKVKNGNTLVDYYGDVRFSEDDLQQMRRGMTAAQKFFEKYGAQYLIAVAPNKEGIYSEYMPKRMQKARVSDQSRMDVAADSLNKIGTVRIVNMKPAILSAKSETGYPLYYKKDTHWNSIGAYVGFGALADVLNDMQIKTFFKPLQDDMVQPAGKVAQDMHPTAKDMSYHVDYLPDNGFEIADSGRKFEIIYENRNPVNDKTLLFMGDSFAEAILPYIAKNFKRVVNVPAGKKDLSVYREWMECYHPDVVIDGMVERYFSRFKKYDKLFGGQ